MKRLHRAARRIQRLERGNQARGGIVLVRHDALLKACARGHTTVAEAQLDHGIDVNIAVETAPMHNTLQLAASGGHAELVAMLLDRGAAAGGLDGYDEGPVRWAAETGNLDLLAVFRALDSSEVQLRAVGKDGHTALSRSLELGKRGTTLALLAAHAPSPPLVLEEAVRCAVADGDMELLIALFKYHGTALANKRKFRLKHKEDARGMNLDAPCPRSGSTALMIACLDDKRSLVDALLKKQVDVNVKGRGGVTALHVAAHADSGAICSMLLGTHTDDEDDNPRSAQLNALDDRGRSPAAKAAGVGAASALAVLLRQGAGTETTDVAGRRPLAIACRQGSGKCAALLLQHGAHPRPPPDTDGMTAIDECIVRAAKYGATEGAYDALAEALGWEAVANNAALWGYTTLYLAMRERSAPAVPTSGKQFSSDCTGDGPPALISVVVPVDWQPGLPLRCRLPGGDGIPQRDIYCQVPAAGKWWRCSWRRPRSATHPCYPPTQHGRECSSPCGYQQCRCRRCLAPSQRGRYSSRTSARARSRRGSSFGIETAPVRSSDARSSSAS